MKAKFVFTAFFFLAICVNAYGINVSVPELSAEPGDVITVEISVEDATGLASADVVLEYDPAVLKALEARKSDLTADFLMASNLEVPGEISLAMAGFPGIAGGGGAILVVDFEAIGPRPSESPLILSEVALFNELGEVIDVTVIDGRVSIEPPGPPVVREHEPGSLMLALEAIYNEANVHGHTYIDIWTGDMPIEAGMFLEFQVIMFSGNPVFRGTVDLHTSDGGNLRDSGAVDQNGVSAHPGTDLSEYARDQWYHRKISLDALTGKTLDGVMIATDSNEHLAGTFRAYVDNIQITDGEYVLLAVYSGEETIPITGTGIANDTSFAGTAGMSNYQVTVMGATSVAPAGKLISSWGRIKGEW